MSRKKRYLLAIMVFLVLNFGYFVAIGSIRKAFSINISSVLIIGVGVSISVIYTIIADNWIRDYQRATSIRFGLIEAKQAKLERKVSRIEEQVRKSINL